MNIIFNILWYIKIKYCFHIININTSCCNICSNKNISLICLKSLHYNISLMLREITMKSLCKIASSLETFSKCIYHSLSITENKSSLWIIVIKKSAYYFNLIFSLNFIIILLYKWYCKFLACHLNKYCIRLLILACYVKNRLWHCC